MLLDEVLDKYTLSELIEINGLTLEEVLEYLVDQQILILPIV